MPSIDGPTIAIEGPRAALRRWRNPIRWTLLVALTVVVVRNLVLFTSTMMTGDDSALRMWPAPLYPCGPLPGTPNTQRYDAEGRLGLDFAQIYFPALPPHALAEAYSAQTTADPEGRPSRYAPLVHFLCTHTFGRLPYGYAALAHVALQALLFVVGFYYGFRVLGITVWFLPSLLLAAFCVFATPVGLSWLERGQFSLYSALAYLFLPLGLLQNRAVYLVLSAGLAFVKWTTFPASFVILAVHLASARSWPQFRSSVRLVGCFALTTLILFGLFFREGMAFVRVLTDQEIQWSPNGISLGVVVPQPLLKVLPLGLILAGWLQARTLQGAWREMTPFVAGAMTMLLMYPTIAYEYNLPSLLGALPLLVYWALAADPGRPNRRWACVGLFLVFMVLASFARSIVGDRPRAVILLYTLTAVALMGAYRVTGDAARSRSD